MIELSTNGKHKAIGVSGYLNYGKDRLSSLTCTKFMACDVWDLVVSLSFLLRGFRLLGGFNFTDRMGRLRSKLVVVSHRVHLFTW